MVLKIKTIASIWLENFLVEIESDSNKSLPGIDIVWLPDASIKEAKERIKSTFKNVWIWLPKSRIILNLSPSDIKKIWTRYDLPMAMAILYLMYQDKIIYKDVLEESLFFGELWLDGSVKRVNGILPSIIYAYKKWYKKFFVPAGNIYELEFLKDIEIFPVENFKQLVDIFIWGHQIQFRQPRQQIDNLLSNQEFEVDFADIKGHLFAKRALMIAAAGLHNVLMVWSPGSGKTMLAKALQSILPPMNYEEILEVSQIYSIIWKLTKENPLIVKRPFRAVHHTASKVSIIWWGANLLPGEISLAHKGILFFDELPEFPRNVLEVLRQPLEDRKITISRASGSVTYPAHFMFVAAMNPCPCGYYKDPEKTCKCSISQIKRYQSKISGPLLDRFDMILEVPREKIDKILEKSKSESSSSIREKVKVAWEIQQKRFENEPISTNSEMTARHIEKYIILTPEAESFLKMAVKTLWLSPRVIHRILKVSRTIADFEKSVKVEQNHIAEALQYRSKSYFDLLEE
jgi:magnesium chelatase family protein